MTTHPIIEAFQRQAEMLDALQTHQGLDSAISELAIWMDARADALTDDDWTMLVNVGGLLYREGLRRRMRAAGMDPPP